MAVTDQAKPAAEALAPAAPDRQARIAIRDLNFYYGKTQALKAINLDVPDKRVVAYDRALRVRQVHTAARHQPHV